MAEPQEEQDRKESPIRGISAVVGLVLGLATLLSMLTYMVIYRQPTAPKIEGKSAQQKQLEQRIADEKALGSYGWVDKDKGVVRIPIEKAMEEVIDKK